MGGPPTVVDGAAAIIVAGAVIVAVGIIVIATAVGSGDRNARADDAGEGGGCGSAATPIIPAGAVNGGVTPARSGRPTPLPPRAPRNPPPPPPPPPPLRPPPPHP